MHFYSLLAAVAVQATAVLAAPSPSSNEPCAVVSAALTTSPVPDQDGNLIVNADKAYACLKSVPVDKAGDLKQLEGMKTMINFQSDLVYLKDPPSGFLYPGVNLVGSIDHIISKVQSGSYDSEYDVQLDLYDVLTSAYDFHLIYKPDILSVFSWSRESYLISVSTDGVSLPNVYDNMDLFALAGLNSSTYKPSPVVKINNTDVEEWLNQYAAFNPWDHDPDVNYNNIFLNIPGAISGSGAGLSFSKNGVHFPGSETILTFANGTSNPVSSYAVLSSGLNFNGVTDGASFAQAFLSGPHASASASASAVPSASGSAVANVRARAVSSAVISVAPSAPASASGSGIASSSVLTNNLFTALASSASLLPAPTYYPQPAVLTGDKYMGGYFPENLPDTAVVSMPSFFPDNDYPFQNAFRTIIATAKSLGKTRLILDVRANGGGHVVDAYSLFKQLFPSMTPYAASNMAAWPLFDAIGEVASDYNNALLDKLQPVSEFDVNEDLKVSLDQYASWSDFYGPVEHHGGEFTNLRRYNFSSPYASLGDPLYGYGNDTNPQPQVFDADNIVILSDGSCGSTCAIFVELLKTQAGVQSITVGGRKQYGPTQPVGGSKGSNDQDLSDLAQAATQAYQKADASEKKAFAPYVNAGLQENVQQMLDRRATWKPISNVNFQNDIRKDDDSVTPLMFVYEASNCRFFYTAPMILDQSLVWAQTYKLRWGNGTCVKGSTGHPSAETGFDTSYFSSAPPKEATNFFGADIAWSYPGAYKADGSHPPPSGSASASASGPASTSPAKATSTSTGAASNSRMVSGGGWGLTGMMAMVFSSVGAVTFLLCN